MRGYNKLELRIDLLDCCNFEVTQRNAWDHGPPSSGYEKRIQCCTAFGGSEVADCTCTVARLQTHIDKHEK